MNVLLPGRPAYEREARPLLNFCPAGLAVPLRISCAAVIMGSIEKVKDFMFVGSPLEGHPIREGDWGCNYGAQYWGIPREKS